MSLDSFVEVLSDKLPNKEIWYGFEEREIHDWMKRHSGIKPKYFVLDAMFLTKELMNKLKKDSLKFNNSLSASELIKAVNKSLDENKRPYYSCYE